MEELISVVVSYYVYKLIQLINLAVSLPLYVIHSTYAYIYVSPVSSQQTISTTTWR